MQDQLTALLEQRGRVHHNAKAHLDGAAERSAADGYDAAADEETWQRFNTELDTLDKRIDEVRAARDGERRAAELRAELGDLGNQNASAGDVDEARSDLDRLRSPEQRSMVFEQRDLTVGTATAGGNLVPEGFANRLFDIMTEDSAIRRTRARVLTTASGNDLPIPTVTAHATAALVAEGAAASENDPTFGQVTLQAFKYMTLLQVSRELYTDSAFDLEGFIATTCGRAVAEASGTDMVVGDGSSKPRGVLTASTKGADAAAAADVDFNDLINLMFSVNARYRAKGEFMLSDTSVSLVRKQVDSNGQYIWQPALTDAEPDRILGKAYVADPNMPEATTGLKSVLFGDFSTYAIRDVGSVAVDVSDEYAFNTDLRTYRVVVRTDGDLIDSTGSIKHLLQA